MDKDRAVAVLITQLDEQDASYEAIVYNDDEYEPVAAVIVVQGKPATEVIVEACERLTGTWKDVKKSASGTVPGS